ncbi:MAG: hypothetical protein R3F11_04795 [Verrucomicrobiales bacterium]
MKPGDSAEAEAGERVEAASREALERFDVTGKPLTEPILIGDVFTVERATSPRQARR